jgi:hypothetical protein
VTWSFGQAAATEVRVVGGDGRVEPRLVLLALAGAGVGRREVTVGEAEFGGVQVALDCAVGRDAVQAGVASAGEAHVAARAVGREWVAPGATAAAATPACP